MFLKLKENQTFIDPITNVIATNAIARIRHLTLSSDIEGNISGLFYLLIFWDNISINPFYTESITLDNDTINTFLIINIPEGLTEINIKDTIQGLCYTYVMNLYDIWELNNYDTINN